MNIIQLFLALVALEIAKLTLLFILSIKERPEGEKRNRFTKDTKDLLITSKETQINSLQDEPKKINDVKNLRVQIERLDKKIEAKSNIITEYKIKDEELALEVMEKEVTMKQEKPKSIAGHKTKKIGEILLEHEFITKDVLAKALEHQKEFGGNITQYFLANDYINEIQLAQCLSAQYGIPYLPLSSYQIPEEIIKLVPVDIAQKYWLIPVEKAGNSLIVVMADPSDLKAIKEVEEFTGYQVQPFVGLLSEIIGALEGCYKFKIKDKELKKAPFFIDIKTYKGPDRRSSIRFKTKIDIQFPVEGVYKKSQTKDVSRGSLFFESDTALPIGSLVTLQINLLKEFNPLPISAIVQVVRVVPLEKNKFDIGVKIIKIAKEEINTIIEYASTHREE